MKITIDIAEKALKLFERKRLQRVFKSFGVRNTKLQSWTTEEELQTLYNLAKGCPNRTVGVEIGSYLGASTLYLCAGLASSQGRLICIDTWMNETMPGGHRDTFAEFSENTKPYKEMIVTFRKKSDQVQLSEIPCGVNIAFIDGDHTYEVVKKDFRLVASAASKNCLVIFHDCKYFQGVSRTVGEALASGEWSLRGMRGNLAWIVRTDFKQ